MNYDELSVEELILHFRSLHDEVYLTVLEDEEFIWRTLTQKEHAEIAEFATGESDANERVCQVAILYPRFNFNSSGRAYLPDVLAPSILDESGFGTIRKEQFLLKTFRNQIEKNFEQQAEILINSAFPYITLEEMSNWTKEKLLRYLAKAEWKLTFVEKKTHLKLMTAEEKRQQLIESGELVESDEEAEAFDIMEVANELRRRGEDPMFVLRDFYTKEKPDYIERPMIGGALQVDTLLAGVEAWKGRGFSYGRYDIISEQVQRVSRR